MYREINLKQADGTEKPVAFKANAATPIRLKQIFHKDFWKIFGSKSDIDQAGIVENLDVISEMAFVMHAQGEGKDMTALSFDDFVAWLETLDGMAILDNAGDILGLYIDQTERGSKAKNPGAQPPAA